MVSMLPPGANTQSHARQLSHAPETISPGPGPGLRLPRLGPGVPEAVGAEAQVPEPAVPGEGGGQRLPSDPAGGPGGADLHSAQFPAGSI